MVCKQHMQSKPTTPMLWAGESARVLHKAYIKCWKVLVQTKAAFARTNVLRNTARVFLMASVRKELTDPLHVT